MADDLKPCPFCGETELPHGTTDKPGGGISHDFIMCGTCGIGFHTEEMACSECGQGVDDPFVAWNRRTVDVEAVLRVAEFLDGFIDDRTVECAAALRKAVGK